jgi:chromosome segregation ATPase
MKRRVASKTNGDAKGARLGASLRGSKPLRDPVKKTIKKRLSRSAASTILGLKAQSELLSEGCTRWSSDGSSAIDHVAECQRLREQLERVLVDHQRQEEEIVALRALAKSLKDEVEAIHERQQLQSSTCSDKAAQGALRSSRFAAHEVFKLDVLAEELEGENAELRRQLEEAQEELRLARTCIADKLPVYKLATVKANAELRCVKSQLQQERTHSDRLQKQLVRCKARQDDVPVRVSPVQGNNQDENDDDQQESGSVRRDREAFLRQCMQLQDITSPPGSTDTMKEQTLRETNDAFPTTWTPSDVPGKTAKPIHEDLLGLDLYLNELNLSENRAPNT